MLFSADPLVSQKEFEAHLKAQVAEDGTILNTVLSLPAPRPKLPSRYESGTDLRASSVVLIISGRIIIARVKVPDNTEYLSFS